MPRLTEAAASYAATEQLKIHTVMHDLGRRNDWIERKRNIIKVCNDALSDPLRRSFKYLKVRQHTAVKIHGLIKFGDVYAADLRRLFEKTKLVPALRLGGVYKRKQLVIHLLTLAEQENVDKIRHRLRVKCGGSSGNNERQKRLALAAADWNAGHGHHVKHCGVRHLVAYRERKHVMLRYRVAAFERIQRNCGVFHLLVHIAPRRKHSLAPDVRQGVHRRVQYAHAEIRHSDLVHIRKAERHSEANAAFVLDYLIKLAAGVACGLLHLGQYSFKSLIHCSLRYYCCGYFTTLTKILQ